MYVIHYCFFSGPKMTEATIDDDKCVIWQAIRRL